MSKEQREKGEGGSKSSSGGDASAPGDGPPAPGRDVITDETTRRRRHGSWRWPIAVVMVAVLVLSVAGVVWLDLRNRDRFRLVCDEGLLTLQRGQRLPRPVGFETVGGTFRPVPLGVDERCVTQHFEARQAAEAAFLEGLLTHIRTALGAEGQASLPQLRLQLRQALQVTQIGFHGARRAEVVGLLADVAYREGRAMLARVETDLRAALARLREAEDLGSDRYDDISEWVQHLEELLRSVAPAPRRPPLPMTGVPPLPPPAPAPPKAPSASPPSAEEATPPEPEQAPSAGDDEGVLM